MRAESQRLLEFKVRWTEKVEFRGFAVISFAFNRKYLCLFFPSKISPQNSTQVLASAPLPLRCFLHYEAELRLNNQHHLPPTSNITHRTDSFWDIGNRILYWKDLTDLVCHNGGISASLWRRTIESPANRLKYTNSIELSLNMVKSSTARHNSGDISLAYGWSPSQFLSLELTPVSVRSFNNSLPSAMSFQAQEEGIRKAEIRELPICRPARSIGAEELGTGMLILSSSRKVRGAMSETFNPDFRVFKHSKLADFCH